MGNRWRDDGDDDDNDDNAQTSVGGGDDVIKWVKKEKELTTIEGRVHDDITIKYVEFLCSFSMYVLVVFFPATS